MLLSYATIKLNKISYITILASIGKEEQLSSWCSKTNANTTSQYKQKMSSY
jgi:hypothetical protein